MKKSAGFTLIELVIVIIILGILGAVAAPRLFNLQGDAYGANLNALKSSLSTAAIMANAKAQIQGVQGTNEVGTSGSDDYQAPKEVKGYEGIKFVNGYPAANKITKSNTEDGAEGDTIKGKPTAGILATLDGFEADRYILDDSNNELTITPASIDKPSYTDEDEACVVVYKEPSAMGESVTIQAYTKGC